MSHSYVHNPVHVVFSTKDRRQLIPKDSQSRLWAYLAGVCKKQKIFGHEIGGIGIEDRLHTLIQILLTLSFFRRYAGDQYQLITMHGSGSSDSASSA